MGRSGTTRLWLLLVMLALFAGGCLGGDSGAPEEPDTLTIQHSFPSSIAEGPPLKKAIQGFQKENPDIEIKQNVVDILDSPEVYETSLVAGDAPEIILINLYAKPTEWLEQDATEPVTDWIEQWGLKDRVKNLALQQWTHENGELQGFPYTGFSWPVWYNTKLLDNAGVGEVPTSTDGLIEASEKLTGAGAGPFVVGGSDWSGNKLFWQVMQSYLTNEEAIELFRSGEFSGSANALKGIELFVRLRDAGIFVEAVEGLTADVMDSQFYGGEAAIMSAGSWAFAGLPDKLVDSVQLGGMPVPDDAVQDKPTAYAGYTTLGIWVSPNGAEKIDVVRKFVEYLYRPEVASSFVELSDGIFSALEVPYDQQKLHPLQAAALTELDKKVSYVVLPDTYIPSDVLTATERATSLAFTPGTGVDEIVSALESAYKE